MVGGASFSTKFLILIRLLRWLVEISEDLNLLTSNRYDFVLYALFDLEQVKRFESRVICECLGVRVTARASEAM